MTNDSSTQDDGTTHSTGANGDAADDTDLLEFDGHDLDDSSDEQSDGDESDGESSDDVDVPDPAVDGDGDDDDGGDNADDGSAADGSDDSDDDVGEAVGAAGQQDAPLGFYVYTKQRDNESKNLRLAVAFDLQPFIGYVETTSVAIVSGGPNPNAAKLFVHFLMREEGVGPWVLGGLGSYSPNPNVGMHPDDALGSFEAWNRLLVANDPVASWELSQDVLDLWLINAQ